MPTQSRRTSKLDLRLSEAAKEKLATAARAVNRSVTDFVLQSSLERADETLADRRLFTLDAKSWAAFQAALDAPTRSNPNLARLMQRPSVFERE